MIVPEPPQTSSIRVRAAVAADEPALAALDRATWSPLHAVLPPPEAGEPFFDERHLPAHYLVAESEEAAVLGYLRLVPPTPMPCNAHVRQIQGLAVAESARGRGVARTLLRAAMDRARAEGARRITLRVLGHNAPARALYESEGFAVEGVLPGEFFLAGGYVDDVLMGRSLLP
ncbi:GNAT family N-acetyltransferase [Streptomyces sp. SKN60]|uniref:GNAT family N-acetyltransferase n=1 Tax=Streptomyces sp. SKN60 TaxID=2855506 RepID=UPI0022457A99|nr:GNAT family N-acetyltransferase [Streptomyces sp. SKN60]MCX2179444.1 GNAT family N-acetyltransferase [Streptomyces sp. SKN60]